MIGIILLFLSADVVNAASLRKLGKMIGKGEIQKAEKYMEEKLLAEKRINACLMLANYYKKTGNEIKTKESLGKAIVYSSIVKFNSFLKTETKINELINFVMKLESEYGYTGSELKEILLFGSLYANNRGFYSEEKAKSSGSSKKEFLLNDANQFITVSGILKSPLVIAIQYAEPEKVHFLIEIEAWTNEQDEKGWTPLMYALRYNKPEYAKLLIEKGEGVNAIDKKGWTPLMFALRYDQPENAKLLIKKSAEINVIEENGRTPLMFALHYNQPENAKLLIEKDAEINAIEKDGWTPLMFACRYSDLSTVKLIISRGAEINTEDNCYRSTPLHLTIYRNDGIAMKSIIIVLKEAGAIIKQNVNGETPYDLAVKKNKPQAILDLLKIE